jgi:hypothetical protein
LDLDETAGSLTDIKLAIEGTHGRIEVSSDGERLFAVALDSIEEIALVDADVSEVLTLVVDNFEGGSNTFADGGGNNLQVEVKRVAASLGGSSHVGETEFADFNGADGGDLRNVDIFDASESLVGGVVVSISNFSS